MLLRTVDMWVKNVCSVFVPLSLIINTKFTDSAQMTMTPGAECVRQCQEGEPPKFCYYKFVAELYVSGGPACSVCMPDQYNVFNENCQCITTDGFERTLFSINRMFPGPSIQVCENDKVIVDVENNIEGNELTMHWHGIWQQGTQYYDGVPMVTQCPILQGTTFRYQMLPQPGTFFYHSHTGLQRFDGLAGQMIIRSPRSKDPNSHLYDFDDPTHVIMISGWMHQHAIEKFPGLITRNSGQDPVNLLINGRGKWINPQYGNVSDSPFEVFTVQPGYRYRFRMINAMSSPCGCVLKVEGHTMTVIATDGENVQPRRVDAISSYSGERYDFILEANQSPGEYWMQFWATDLCEPSKITQFAVLHYNAKPRRTLGNQASYQSLKNNMGLTLNPPTKTCADDLPNGICVSNLRSATPTKDTGLLKREPDIKIYISYTFAIFEPRDLFVPKTYTKYSVLVPGPYLVQSYVNGFSFIFPSSPLISQYEDAEKQVCNRDKIPKDCSRTNFRNCTCTHVMHIPLGSVVEVVFIDEVPFDDVHSFHLHGYVFRVLGMGSPEDFGLKKLDKDLVMRLDQQGRLKKNFNNPPAKDSVVVPNHGYSVLRFRADNPGPWLFHCHFEVHMAVGMAFIFQVGDMDDLPPVPEGFPRCGNFLPNYLDPALHSRASWM